MSVVSLEVLGFMAVAIALFWAVPARWRFGVLGLLTLGTLGALAPLSLALIAATGVSSYALVRAGATSVWHWLYAVAAFALFLCLREFAGGGWVWFGAAFYMLRAIHVVLDTPRRTLPTFGWRDYAAYLLFLPVMAVGPIERFQSFEREYRRHRWNAAYFSSGLETMLYGYAQVTIVANVLIDDKLWELIDIMPAGVAQEWAYAFRYGASLYVKFAGYSDIAIGFALMLGVRVRGNFNRPYLAANIAEFWRRWHMSLSEWCRDYVNLPVLALTRNRAAAALAAMIVLGLWHEMSLRYLLWGVYHGLGIALWQGWRQLRPSLPQLPARLQWIGRAAGWLLTMAFVISSFAITRESTLTQSFASLASLFGLGGV